MGVFQALTRICQNFSDFIAILRSLVNIRDRNQLSDRQIEALERVAAADLENLSVEQQLLFYSDLKYVYGFKFPKSAYELLRTANDPSMAVSQFPFVAELFVLDHCENTIRFSVLGRALRVESASLWRVRVILGSAAGIALALALGGILAIVFAMGHQQTILAIGSAMLLVGGIAIWRKGSQYESCLREFINAIPNLLERPGPIS